MQIGLERIAEKHRTVNQLLKRPVREICRRASVRAAHREVRGYSTLGVKFPRATRLEPSHFKDARYSAHLHSSSYVDPLP